VRPRLVVALAALIAAGVLVASTGSADSRAPLRAQRLAPGTFRQLAAAAPVGTMAMTTTSLDAAYRSADDLAPDSPLREPARRVMPTARPAVDQPAARERSVEKNVWRLDPNVSFYGPGFYGRRTACGYTYTTAVLGVAHRTLPCGTRVTFQNPANGRTITVPVIDRGPYVVGRQWDLSGATCSYLGACHTGPLLWRFAAG